MPSIWWRALVTKTRARCALSLSTKQKGIEEQEVIEINTEYETSNNNMEANALMGENL